MQFHWISIIAWVFRAPTLCFSWAPGSNNIIFVRFICFYCFISELESLLFSVVSLLHLVENNTVQLLQSICDLVTTGANEDNAHHRLKM